MSPSRTLLFAAALLCCGCYTRTTQIPGVLDLRTDASDEKPAIPATTASRSAVSSVFLGRGVYLSDGLLHVEDRSYWALGFFPVYNVDSRENLQAALQSVGALRHVRIEERVTPLDAALYALKLVPVVNFVMCWATPTFTFRAHAEPVEEP